MNRLCKQNNLEINFMNKLYNQTLKTNFMNKLYEQTL